MGKLINFLRCNTLIVEILVEVYINFSRMIILLYSGSATLEIYTLLTSIHLWHILFVLKKMVVEALISSMSLDKKNLARHLINKNG